jgi:hypothetical protein
VGRGMRVRNVAASSFPSRRLMMPGEGPSGPDQRSPSAHRARTPRAENHERGSSRRDVTAVRAWRCAPARRGARLLGDDEGNDIATRKNKKKTVFWRVFFFVKSWSQ